VETPPGEPHVWVTLGYRSVEQGDGVSVIEWDATVDYSFPGSSGPIVHGGLVTTILDTAMGGACHSVLDAGEAFLTADLHVESRDATGGGSGRAADEASGVLRGRSAGRGRSATRERALHAGAPLRSQVTGTSRTARV
jgi:hypothetical protein